MLTSLPIVLIFLPIVTAIVIYLAHHKMVSRLAFVTQAIQTVLFFTLLQNYPSIAGVPIPLSGWSTVSGIVLRIDAMAMAFMGLALFMWWMVLIYSWQVGYREYRYLFFLMFLQGAFLGLMLVDDLFSFFVLFEIATIISSILVVYKKEGKALLSGLYYLLLGTTGMSAYLLGVILVYMMTGTLNWTQSTLALAEIGPILPVKVAYILLVTAVTVKGAFVPAFDWLRRAHSNAPDAISALLSGLLVKGGVYGFLRIQQLFGGPVLGDFFLYVGIATAITGIIFAVSQKDIKLILAFHTVSQVGIVLTGVSAYAGNMYYGGLLHLVNHAMFKSLLFLGAGVIVAHYKTRKVTEIRGTFQTMPVASLCMLVGCLAISGTPLLNGYTGKALVAYGLYDSLLLTWLFKFINLGTIVSFMKLGQIFFPAGDFPVRPDLPAGETYRLPARKPTWNIAMLSLAAACFLLPIFYGRLGMLVGTEFPHVPLFNAQKYLEWAITVCVGALVIRYYIFTDRSKRALQVIREVDTPFYRTAYMLVLFMTVMFLQIL